MGGAVIIVAQLNRAELLWGCDLAAKILERSRCGISVTVAAEELRVRAAYACVPQLVWSFAVRRAEIGASR